MAGMRDVFDEVKDEASVRSGVDATLLGRRGVEGVARPDGLESAMAI